MKKFFVTVCASVLLTACSCGNKMDKENTSSYESGVDSGMASAAVMPTDDAMSKSTELYKVGDRVFFAFNVSSLSDEAKETLNKQADFIKDHDDLDFVIEGHTDERGTREYNLALGERRANSVKNHLVNKGVKADKVGVVSYGKERPAVDGNNEEAWKQNRRAVTKILN